MTRLLLALWLFCGVAHAQFMTGGWDYEARKWQVSIGTNGGTLSATGYTVGTTYMQSIKRWGVRPLIGRAVIYVGTGTNALLVPIIRDWFTTADNTDSLVAFAAADYSEATGLTGNGTTKYLRVNSAEGLNMASFGTAVNLHFAAYVRTGSNEASDAMGMSNGANNWGLGVANGGVTYIFMGLNTPNVADANGVGFYMSTRSSTTNAFTYKNGAALVTSTASDAGVLGTGTLAVHAFNVAGTIGGYSSRAQSYYAVGFAVPANRQAAYYTAVRNIQVAYNRQVE